MESFTIELHSSASGNIFRTNSSASFSNLLPEQLHLSGEWEVAVTEISYPSKICNITEGRFETSIVRKGVKHLEYFNLQPGCYDSIDSVVIALISKVSQSSRYVNYIDKALLNNLITCEIDPVSQQLKLATIKDFHLGLISDDLQHIFGFIPSKFDVLIDQVPRVSPLAFDLQRIHSILLYTDFINSNILGDSKVPNLKTFAIEKTEESGIRSKTFMQLDFRRVLKHSIHSISVELRSPTGELIPFLSCGYTRLNLLFKKVKDGNRI